ncbi:MAG: helix-turn-helix domain-containing protein [Atopobiaceae bacterium]|nr:helix-turn-helix domain-containing protein [Atopobiaceae bacterium]MBQ6410548.1 helix-turn-helix domain-containing protein [Atopobiaceae bacterium]MBQ6651681.1 helix-turn-helix domain-containing protein [Atopobiaceae bacterium]
MAIKDVLPQMRKERGLTQEELARRLYVTRQAVSRWETGETTPSIDMAKLIALALDVPVMRLLDLPQEPSCQCCGTPFSVPDMPKGTDADGTENPDYCKWCYDDGKFTGATMDDVIEHSAPYLAQAAGMSLDEAVSFMGALLPTLGRWRDER